MRANNNEENENQNKKDIVRKEKNRGISTDIHTHLPQAGFYLAKKGENFTFKKHAFWGWELDWTARLSKHDS